MFDISIPLIIQIFVLVNPLASFPLLVSAYESKLNAKIVAVKSVVVAFAIAVSIALFGPFLFSMFGITLDSFRIAGGVVLLLLAINMVRPPEKEEHEPHHKITSLITIIATPLLTGPATISFITIKAFEIGKVAILVNLLIAFILVALVFIMFAFAVKKINLTVVDILSRIMGLFLSAVAIEMIARGIQGLIAGA
jgi:multiple antibiotic resistance protein